MNLTPWLAGTISHHPTVERIDEGGTSSDLMLVENFR
jgi:hypothetical protein